MSIKDDQIYLSSGCEKWSELEAAHIKDPELAKALRTISRNYRKAPSNEKPLDFFSPTLADVSGKDDVSLMDIAVFGLGKKPRFEPIVHELRDATVTIQGGTSCGMATIFDYDIFLFVVSYLVREMDSIKAKISTGKDAYLPPRKIRPPVTELLKFCRRDSEGHYGVKQYLLLESALERLKSTTITIKKKDGSKRRAGFFSLVGDVKVISETSTGKISIIEIGIPEWVYDGIVRVENPAVLTLNPDYFLLNGGYHRFLHRVARKCAGKGEWFMTLEELRQRSGTTQQVRYFKRDIKRAISDLEKNPLPDYSVTYLAKNREDRILFSYIGGD